MIRLGLSVRLFNALHNIAPTSAFASRDALVAWVACLPETNRDCAHWMAHFHDGAAAARTRVFRKAKSIGPKGYEELYDWLARSGDEGLILRPKGKAPKRKMVEDQPAPKPNASRPIWDLVIEDMRERDLLGRERYGTPLQAHNGRDALIDAYQEALDLVAYLRQLIKERADEGDQ